MWYAETIYIFVIISAKLNTRLLNKHIFISNFFPLPALENKFSPPSKLVIFIYKFPFKQAHLNAFENVAFNTSFPLGNNLTNQS